jgi:methyl-accepting chemotaxis protein
MAIRQAQIKQENALSTQKIENQKVILERSFSNIKEVVEHLTEMGFELNNSTESALNSAKISLEDGLNINKKTEKQYEETENTDNLVNNFVNSISSINENLAKQTNNISSIAEACTKLSKNTEIITKNIEETVVFTNSLAELTENGEKSAVHLDSAMQEISASSDAITSIIDVVYDFSERSNILAMNAAIEAAHAGLVGRGFAIIANEIKVLSSQQKTQVGQIRNIIQDITQKIQEGAAYAKKVHVSLMQITNGAQNSAEQIKQIAQKSMEQEQNTTFINGSMEDLTIDSVEIQKQLENMSENSGKVRKAVNVIAKESNEVMQATHDIIDNNSTLTDLMQTLKQLVSKSAQMTEKLLEGTQSV